MLLDGEFARPVYQDEVNNHDRPDAGEDAILRARVGLGGFGEVGIVSEPIRALQRVFEGEQYVNRSLVIPLSKDLRDHLDNVMECWAPRFIVVEDAQFPKIGRDARAVMRPCLKALERDVLDRRATERTSLEFARAPAGKPQGYTNVQMPATVCDPRLHE